MTELEVQLKPLVDAIRSGKKVTFFQGAGISTNAGIPDFRSPNTGLYANLSKFDLPYPEAVFDIDYFKKKPSAFYMLAHELYPGKFEPTKYHYMLKLLQNRNQIQRIYTQNIDTLERIVGIEPELIVEAHGSFASNHCIKCSEEMSVELIKQHMAKVHNADGIPRCGKCQGLVKPDITFFGEGLPPRFFDLWDEDCETVELAIVAGTSLGVYPFAGLPAEIDSSTLRVLINQELAGDFTRKSDIVILDDCDKIAEKIISLLGWDHEFDLIIQNYKEKIRNQDLENARNDLENVKLDDKDEEGKPTKDVNEKATKDVESKDKMEAKVNSEGNVQGLAATVGEVVSKPEINNDSKSGTDKLSENLKTAIATQFYEVTDDDISNLDKQIADLDIKDYKSDRK